VFFFVKKGVFTNWFLELGKSEKHLSNDPPPPKKKNGVIEINNKPQHLKIIKHINALED
jgi:hypothetical protein